MKAAKILFFTAMIASLYSCSAQKKLRNKLPANLSNTLFQEYRGMRRYLFCTGDTIYSERYKLEKPSFFMDFDTLVRVGSSNIFKGKGKLEVTDNALVLSYSTGRLAGYTWKFIVATDQQKQEWNWRKNYIKYSQYSNIDDHLRSGSNTDEKRKELLKEWEALLDEAKHTDQKTFDARLAAFRLKVSGRLD